MKKLIALLLVLCLAFAGLVGYLNFSESSPAVPEATPVPDAPEATAPSADEEIDLDAVDAEAEPITVRSLDYDAIYALHAPDEVVLTVDGRDVTWDRYFYMLFSQSQQITNYFQGMAAYYGLALDWQDEYAEGLTYADSVVSEAEDSLAQLYAIEGFAQANGVALTEENLAALDEQLLADSKAICGEDATEEDFAAYLADIYMTPDLYRWICNDNLLYQQNYIQLYGENGELFDEEVAMAFLTDNGYLSASHILFMTIDPATGEALGEDEKLGKRNNAEAVAAELQAIEDSEELLARFAALKEELCEDTGKVAYPDGYTFTPGTMVAEFEDTVKALRDYEVSDVIETGYGYHVIMRLPLSIDAVIEFSSDGVTPMTARRIASNEEYGARLQAYYDDIRVEYAEGFEPVNLLDYVIQ